MRTIGKLRAALTMGYGFSGVVRLVEEFRGRVIARQDPSFDSAVAAAAAEIRSARESAGEHRAPSVA
ncbi:hypothetical protein [Streptomyces sp. NPDC088196]|uniref:hypothetical protein n=1 Tax=Streptomyces sp. NPDC088196 TaxID=3154868 RepID=UPI00344ED7DD